MPDISVVIRTRNPHRPTFARVLEALRAQTFPLARTELLVVDNGSEPALDVDGLGLAWHPRARVVREPQPGKILAQHRGIREASPGSALLLFVDDDNWLHPDYLEAGERLAAGFPQLGAWGSARINLVHESPPPAEVVPFLGGLTAWDHAHDLWANFRGLNYSVPAGAGLFVRRQVAEHWCETFEGSPVRRAFWASGNPPILFSEDTDLALTAPDLGLATGIFRALRVEHLIRPEKTRVEHLLGLMRNQQCAEVLIKHVRGLDVRTGWQDLRQRTVDHAKLLFLSGLRRRFHWHLLRGQAQGRRLLRAYRAGQPDGGGR